MAQRYHYSPEKAAVMPCRAEQGGCKFGDQPHFDNLDQVKEFYAEMYRDQTFATHSKEASPQSGGGGGNFRKPPEWGATSPDPKGDGLDEDRQRLIDMEDDINELSGMINDQSIPASERISMSKQLRGISAHAKNLHAKIEREENRMIEEKRIAEGREYNMAPPPPLTRPMPSLEEAYRDTSQANSNSNMAGTPVSNADAPNESATPAPLRKSKPKDPNAPMGMRELNEEAKTTSDPKVLMDAAERGSARVLTSLSRNKNATGESLVKASEKAEEMADRHLKRDLQRHPNYPVSNLSPREYANTLTEENYKERSASNEITDEHFNAASTDAPNRVRSDVMIAMALNKENKMSQERVNSFMENEVGSSAMVKAIASGRYSLEDNAEKVDTARLSIMAGDKDLGSENNKAIARELGKRSLTDLSSWDKSLVREGLAKVAASETSDEETRNFAVSMIPAGEGSYETTQLHSNPRLSPEAKRTLEEKIPSLKPKGDFERRVATTGKDESTVRGEIIESRESTVLGRSYTGYSVKLNMDKVREYGFTENELRYALGASNHNAGSHLDMDKGTYSGRTDSSD